MGIMTDNFSWAKEHPSVSLYVFNRKAPEPKISYLRGFFRYINTLKEYEEMTPDGLIEAQIKAQRIAQDKGDPRLNYVVTRLLSRYLASITDRRASYKGNIASCVYTFFKVNRVPLPEDGEVLRAAKMGTTRKVNKDQWVNVDHLADLKKLVEGDANPLYRCVWLAMYTAGMGMNEVVEWSNQGVEETALKLEKRLYGHKAMRIDLEPRKDLPENYVYHTYLYTADSVKVLEAWLKHRERRARYLEQRYGVDLESKAGRALFVTRHNTPLNEDTLYNHWTYRSTRLGIYERAATPSPSNRYGWSPHIIRSFFKTWGWKTPAKNWIWDAMMGHGVDSNEYMRLFNDDRWMLEELKKAEPWFNLLSSPAAFDLESTYTIKTYQREQQERIEDLERQQRDLITMKTEIERQREEFERNVALVVRRELAKERLKRRE